MLHMPKRDNLPVPAEPGQPGGEKLNTAYKAGNAKGTPKAREGSEKS